MERVEHLASSERKSTAALVASLAELDARGLCFGLGYKSLFAYCTEHLHLSEHEALNRIEAARAGRVFPVILDRLAEGALTLTSIRLLRPLLTRENHVDVIERARHLGKQGVLELIARLRPQSPIPPTIRTLPAPRPPIEIHTSTTPGADEAPRGLDFSQASSRSVTPARRPIVSPLSPEHFRVQVTFGRAAHDKLRRAQALLRHQIPNGDPAAILERGLDALLIDLLKKKAAAVEHPRTPRGANGRSRHIPADVRRKVWVRDGGVCAFKGANGRRCSEVGCLEYHHVEPHAVGGEATVDNIELRCRAHNKYEVELFFGAET